MYSSCTPFRLAPRLDPPFESSLQVDLHKIIRDHVVELVFVRSSNVIENRLLQILHLRLVVELQKQITDSAEAFAVVRSDAVRGKTGDVFARRPVRPRRCRNDATDAGAST